MAEIINIDKEKIPYRIKIKFSNGIFEFRFRYMKFQDRVYVDLYDNDENLIYDGWKITYGIPLFFSVMQDVNGNLNPDYPDKWIIPLSTDGTEYVCNLNNIGTNIFLSLFERQGLSGEIDVTLYD